MAKERRKTTKEEPEDLKVDREGLLASLTKLKPALRSGAAIPELSHLWFNKQHAFAYDGGLGIRVPLDTELDCGVPGAAMLALLKTSSLKQVALEVDEGTLTVGLGRSRSKLNTLDLDREVWPFSAPPSEGVELSEKFIEALRSVLLVKASPAIRVEHHGVLVFSEKKHTDLYTTDSSTIARATLEEKLALPELTLLPRPFAEQLVAQCPAGAKLVVEDDHMVAIGAGIELYSNVLDVTDVADIRTVTNKALKAHPTDVVLPAGFEAALDRAAVLSGGGEAWIELTIEGNELRIDGKFVNGFGELAERLELEEEHPEVEFSADTVLLQRALRVADTFSAVDSSMAFYGGDDFLYVVASRA